MKESREWLLLKSERSFCISVLISLFTSFIMFLRLFFLYLFIYYSFLIFLNLMFILSLPLIISSFW
jgi:hypothetical protein